MGFSIERINKPFVVKSPYKPSGDQPQAIEELATRIENGENDVVLMGRHRHRQDGHHGLADRAPAASHADHRAEQDAGRAAVRRIPAS